LVQPAPLQKQREPLESPSTTLIPPQLTLSSHLIWMQDDPLKEMLELPQVLKAHCNSTLPAVKDIWLSSQGCAKGSLGLPASRHWTQCFEGPVPAAEKRKMPCLQAAGREQNRSLDKNMVTCSQALKLRQAAELTPEMLVRKLQARMPRQQTSGGQLGLPDVRAKLASLVTCARSSVRHAELPSQQRAAKSLTRQL